MSGIFGNMFGGKHNDRKAREAAERAAAAFDNIDLPSDFRELEYLGDWTPETTSYQNIDSEFNNLSSDPALRQNQLAQLAALQEIADNGGMTLQDRANLSRIQSQTASADRGNREAIMQNMQARGMGGSGMELLANLQSGQAAADRNAQSSLDVAAEAQRRALDAITRSGDVSGQIRNQDFGEAATIASAKDRINQFNASNSLQNSQFNVNNQNQAARDSWGAKQDIANQNVNNHNQQQQQNFQNQMGVAQGKQAGQHGIQGYHQTQGDRKAASEGALLGGVGTIAGGWLAGGKK